MKTIVIIPAFNESKYISSILCSVINFVDNIVLIDDGSTDKTAEIAKQVSDKICVLRHRINLGKGAALKTGCLAALKLEADIIITMDADGQHKPEDIPRFTKEIQENDVDIVFGSRKIGEGMPYMMRVGNKFLSVIVNLLFRVYISDTQSGFRAFKANVFDKIKWNSHNYSVETEMIVNAGKNKLKYSEIIIDTIYHDKYKGTTIFDGLRIFFNLLIWKLI